ncbi:hypothetical protein EGW08_019117, partial [Elysia chlorotica]
MYLLSSYSMKMHIRSSCCLQSVQLSSSGIPRSSRVARLSRSWISPCTLDLADLPSRGYHWVTPVDGSIYTLTSSMMLTLPRKSSTLVSSLLRADCATCLKKRPRPLSPDTSFSFLAASTTENSSSWSLERWGRRTKREVTYNRNFSFHTGLSVLGLTWVVFMSLAGRLSLTAAFLLPLRRSENFCLEL